MISKVSKHKFTRVILLSIYTAKLVKDSSHTFNDDKSTVYTPILPIQRSVAVT